MIIENYRIEPQGLGCSWWANCPYIMHRYPHQTPARIKGTLKELRGGQRGSSWHYNTASPLNGPPGGSQCPLSWPLTQERGQLRDSPSPSH